MRILSRRKKTLTEVDLFRPIQGNLDSGIQESFACGIQNPAKFLFVESGILGFGKRNTAQGIRNPLLIAIGIHFPTSIDKESGIQYLESGIHGVESRIPDCLGFHYLGRFRNDISRFGRYF